MKLPLHRRVACAGLGLLVAWLPLTVRADEQPSESIPADLPATHFHLTARPWHPVNAPKEEFYAEMDAAAHALALYQYWNEKDPNDVKNGAMFDPIDKREIQYATPCFAFNVAALLSQGHAADLLTQGMRAMERCTLNISTGFANDYHGEFFCAPMVKAIRLYESLQSKYPQITDEVLKTWKKRMKAKRDHFMSLKVKQNWRTFAMKGEWLRQKDGYITDGVAWNEADWIKAVEGGQRERFRRDLDKYHLNPNFFFYHDDTAHPETFAYNGATTANLLDMLEDGYNGASAQEMRELIYHNLTSSLYILSGSGEAAAGGRTGEHIWDDTIYADGMEKMAEISQRNGDIWHAGQFRHAVELLLKSHARFQQESGLFSITKNAFHPFLKNRYASWSGVANYENFTLTCALETLLAQTAEITETPIPSEIGGYVMTLDPSFANVFLDAGGMQAQICNQGESDKYGNVQWHTLGITRFSRTGWDGRLGPGAGHTNLDFSDGFSFSPVFLEKGKWVRVCMEPNRFHGEFKAEFVHPLLVRGAYTILPEKGQTGPTFKMHVTLTPDGALVDTSAAGGEQVGVVWPLFEFDGRTVVNTDVTNSIASTAYPRMAGSAKLLEAEDASLSEGAAIASDQTGFHGKGFAKITAKGASLEWKGVDGGDGGPTAIGFRYALGAAAKATSRFKLLVNGQPQRDLIFLSTGQWNSWFPLTVPATLAHGTENTIRIESTDEKNIAIIDELRVYPASSATAEPDQQNFIALKDTHDLDTKSPVVRGGYGDYLPIRVTDSRGGTVETFVYPRSAGDPDARSVRASFKRDGDDFSSLLGGVKGTLYVGRTSAGGEGKEIDLTNDGKNVVTFDRFCSFVLQLKDGKVTAVETDRPVKATIAGKTISLDKFTPAKID
jgi:hypothetical protein